MHEGLFNDQWELIPFSNLIGLFSFYKKEKSLFCPSLKPEKGHFCPSKYLSFHINALNFVNKEIFTYFLSSIYCSLVKEFE